MNSNNSEYDKFVALYSVASELQKWALALLLSRSLSVVLRDTYRSAGAQRLVDADGVVRGNELLIRLLTAATGLVLSGHGASAYPGDSLLAFMEEYRKSNAENDGRLQLAVRDVNRQVESAGGVSELV